MKVISFVKYPFFALLLISFAYSQEATDNNDVKGNNVKSINEINYQLPAAIGYSHIWNIKNKFLIGTDLHLGFAGYWPKFSDFLLFSIFTRNIFNKDKLNKRWEYDIGIFTSFSFQHELIVGGLNLSGNYVLYKFKFGINMLNGISKYNDKIIFLPLLAPKFSYKF
ncbi:MAG: hypothetical protein B6D61_08115 [Bacteroidetes bacterium 4484_249]|nr:MAG: hypothetical protein B6D61_08115 [Bacteroidetes bacterium 4484_249]